ncbi:MAG: hypothetical protein OHK0036_20150 [Bacteroidia bacterium]
MIIILGILLIIGGVILFISDILSPYNNDDFFESKYSGYIYGILLFLAGVYIIIENILN